METRQKRLQQLVDELRAAEGRLTGRELALRLGVTPRSVRDYVRAVNSGAQLPLIVSDQDGYRLNERAYRRHRNSQSKRRTGYDSPEQRLYYIVRYLVGHAEGADVFDLGERLSVSPATIEADLGRARELLREHQLVIRREREIVRIEGPERQQRKLVRHLLLGSGQTGLPSLDGPQQHGRARRLHDAAIGHLAEAGLEVNEYVLNDLVMHLTIAADRISAGHVLTTTGDPLPTGRHAAVWEATEGLADAVRQIFDVVLSEADLQNLHDILATRVSETAVRTAVSDRALGITREALRDLSNQFLLDLYDESTVWALALHVQALILRARNGESLDTPLGPDFRNMHPLIHELALQFAHRIEASTQIEVGAGEVDFLAFHLGNQVQRQMTQGPPVTITCVAPRYSTLHEELAARLARIVQENAVVESLVTSLSHDWSTVTSDLVVSVVDLDLDTLPVLRISPFLTEADIDKVAAAVRAERVRTARAKLRANMISLLDPNLFHHREQVASKLEALTLLSRTLEQEGYVGRGFLADVLDRERRSPTAFGGQFAIPHSMYMDAAKTGIAVLVSDTPIPWGPSAVRLVLMFAVSPEGRPVFRDVLDELIGVLNDPANIVTLLDACQDHHGFVRRLSGLLTY